MYWVGEMHAPLEPSVELPTGPRSAALVGETHAGCATGPSSELPVRPQSEVLGGETHAGCAIEAFGGAPYGATKGCIGWEGLMRGAPVEPSVELPMWPRSVYLVWETHAGCATGAFGGAPHGATKRCTGCGGRMRAAPLGPSEELHRALSGRPVRLWRRLGAPLGRLGAVFEAPGAVLERTI